MRDKTNSTITNVLFYSDRVGKSFGKLFQSKKANRDRKIKQI